MSDSDQMRADFEKWANQYGWNLRNHLGSYYWAEAAREWQIWQAAYAAGQKAEREALCIQWEGADATIAEVERLRAELAQLRKDWCDDDEAIKQQALRVLDAAKVEGDSVYVPRMGALAEMMAYEIERLRDELCETKAENVVWEESYDKLKAELAAAKAASVVPDEEVQAAFEKWLEYECWECHRIICKATWQAAIRWMIKRMKNQTTPAA